MERHILLLLIMFINAKIVGIGIEINDPNVSSHNCWNLKENSTEYVRQFVFPISRNGNNLNTIVQFTVTGVTDAMGVRIRNFSTGAVFENNTYSFANGNRGPFTFDATNASSGRYRLEFYYLASGNAINIKKTDPITGELKDVNFYFVTERQKTGTFANSNNFNYKINWVDSWLKDIDNDPNHVSANYFLTIAEEALNFNWYRQINQWDLCDVTGMLHTIPLRQSFTRGST